MLISTLYISLRLYKKKTLVSHTDCVYKKKGKTYVIKMCKSYLFGCKQITVWGLRCPTAVRNVFQHKPSIKVNYVEKYSAQTAETKIDLLGKGGTKSIEKLYKLV